MGQYQHLSLDERSLCICMKRNPSFLLIKILNEASLCPVLSCELINQLQHWMLRPVSERGIQGIQGDLSCVNDKERTKPGLVPFKSKFVTKYLSLIAYSREEQSQNHPHRSSSIFIAGLCPQSLIKNRGKAQMAAGRAGRAERPRAPPQIVQVI